MYKLAPVDYFLAALIALFLYMMGHVLIADYMYNDHCQAICAPQNYDVSARLFTTEVSCICDLTKQRIEVP